LTRQCIAALLATGALRQAEHHAELAYASAGGRLREMVSALALADVRLRHGAARAAEAHGWYERALGLANELGVRSVAAEATLGLGELAGARGDSAAATRLFEEALGIYRRLGFGHYASRAERLLAEGDRDVQLIASGIVLKSSS
jgi:tetratricopeptide (TPR) repeat protein